MDEIWLISEGTSRLKAFLYSFCQSKKKKKTTHFIAIQVAKENFTLMNLSSATKNHCSWTLRYGSDQNWSLHPLVNGATSLCYQINEIVKLKSHCLPPGCERVAVEFRCFPRAVRCVAHLGVEGKDTLMIPTDKEDGWQVFRQGFQPGHVEGTRHSTFAGNWQTPGTRKKRESVVYRVTNRINNYMLYIMATLSICQSPWKIFFKSPLRIANKNFYTW